MCECDKYTKRELRHFMWGVEKVLGTVARIGSNWMGLAGHYEFSDLNLSGIGKN